MSLAKFSIILAAAAFQDSEPIDQGAALSVPPARESGFATWYGDGTLHGAITASGEALDPDAYTCAHRTLPLQTTVLVVNAAEPNRRVWCRVNDRGPYGAINQDGEWTIRGPADGPEYRGLIDLSVATAQALGTFGKGRQRVDVHYWTRDTRTMKTLAVVRRKSE